MAASLFVHDHCFSMHSPVVSSPLSRDEGSPEVRSSGSSTPRHQEAIDWESVAKDALEAANHFAQEVEAHTAKIEQLGHDKGDLEALLETKHAAYEHEMKALKAQMEALQKEKDALGQKAFASTITEEERASIRRQFAEAESQSKKLADTYESKERQHLQTIQQLREKISAFVKQFDEEVQRVERANKQAAYYGKFCRYGGAFLGVVIGVGMAPATATLATIATTSALIGSVGTLTGYWLSPSGETLNAQTLQSKVQKINKEVSDEGK